jgi:hypothetical protein
MTTENPNLTAPESQEQRPAGQQPNFSYADVESNFRTRLKKEKERHQKETDVLKNRLDDLEKKITSGKATQSENLEYQTGLNAADEASKQVASGQITPEDFDSIVRFRMMEEKASEKIKDAMDKDTEFKGLVESNNAMPKGQQLLSTEDVLEMIGRDIKNIPAVVKHLLKNAKDRQIFRLASNHQARDGGISLTQFVHDLSEKLEMNASRPRPNEFSIIPKVTDAGATEDFSEASYISEKYT